VSTPSTSPPFWAGPRDLFGEFYVGVRQIKTKIIDGLEGLDGRFTAPYPEK
jgi:hypothetical protein